MFWDINSIGMCYNDTTGWLFDIDSGNGLVPLGNNPLHDPLLSKFVTSTSDYKHNLNKTKQNENNLDILWIVKWNGFWYHWNKTFAFSTIAIEIHGKPLPKRWNKWRSNASLGDNVSKKGLLKVKLQTIASIY